jgi:hypothetical protein
VRYKIALTASRLKYQFVLRLHVASAGHVTREAYSWIREVYVLQRSMCSRAPRKRSNFLELRDGEVRRNRLKRTSEKAQKAKFVELIF